jgi:putative transposase
LRPRVPAYFRFSPPLFQDFFPKISSFVGVHHRTIEPAKQIFRALSEIGASYFRHFVRHRRHVNGVKLEFSRPGKPADNVFSESFNGKFHQESLNQHWFLPFEDAQEVIEAWKEDYNQHRPHSALGDRCWPSSQFFQGG